MKLTKKIFFHSKNTSKKSGKIFLLVKMGKQEFPVFLFLLVKKMEKTFPVFHFFTSHKKNWKNLKTKKLKFLPYK